MHWVHRHFLEAIEDWATGCRIVTEFEIAYSGSRPDAILIPMTWTALGMGKETKRDGEHAAYWERFGLTGVEIKTNRDDFVRGIREKQFDRYKKSGLSALYVATKAGDVKTSEIPRGVGHLVVRDAPPKPGRYVKSWRAVCRRRPVWRRDRLSRETIWKLVHHLERIHETELRNREVQSEKIEKMFGSKAGSTIFRALRKLDEAF